MYLLICQTFVECQLCTRICVGSWDHEVKKIGVLLSKSLDFSEKKRNSQPEYGVVIPRTKGSTGMCEKTLHTPLMSEIVTANAFL